MSDTPRTDAFQQGIDRRAFRRGRVDWHDVFDMGDFARQLERENAKLKADAERLDWAERNPLEAYARIVAQWADCGRGGREGFFNFRHAIDAAMKSALDTPKRAD